MAYSLVSPLHKRVIGNSRWEHGVRFYTADCDAAFSTHSHRYTVLWLRHTGKFSLGDGALFFGVMLVNCVKALIHSATFTVPVTQYCMISGICVSCLL